MVPSNVISRASFQRPKLMIASAWLEHAPFAFWLVESHRPQCVVELGAHHGFSYFCFCQKIRELDLKTKCFAVDTWEGDEHAGFYGGEVFEHVRRYHDAHYADFSRLVRYTFDEAASQFSDGSIDLLHIDGRHRYEDVKHDYETWRPKLSPRAVVLFHDTQVKERNFGVFRFWAEIEKEFPNFEFLHGHGLGVFGVGHDPAVAMLPIFTLDDRAAEATRAAYDRLGAVISGRKSLSRNEPCPCGSEKRFKHCHGAYS